MALDGFGKKKDEPPTGPERDTMALEGRRELGGHQQVAEQLPYYLSRSSKPYTHCQLPIFLFIIIHWLTGVQVLVMSLSSR